MSKSRLRSGVRRLLMLFFDSKRNFDPRGVFEREVEGLKRKLKGYMDKYNGVNKKLKVCKRLLKEKNVQKVRYAGDYRV